MSINFLFTDPQNYREQMPSSTWNNVVNNGGGGGGGGAVNQVSNTDNNLNINPTSGDVVVNLANDINVQSLGITDQYTLPLIAGTAGYVLSSAGTGNTCEWVPNGGGGGGAVNEVTNTDNNLNINPTTGNVVINLSNTLSVQNEIIPNVASASSVINVGNNNLALAKGTTGTGDRFVVIGNNSGNGLTATGSSLVVIAGSNCCGADSNFASGVIVGNESGYNLTGIDNVIVGNGSMSDTNNVTSAYNTVIGHASGKGISNGHENILIGSNCGNSTIPSSTLVVGNVVVGANSAYSLQSDSGSNVLLGNGVDVIAPNYSSSFIVGSNNGTFPANQSNIQTMQIGDIINGSASNVKTAGGFTCCANQQNGFFDFTNDGNITLPLNSNGSADTYIQAGNGTTSNAIDMFVNWDGNNVWGGEVYVDNGESYISNDSGKNYISIDNTTAAGTGTCTINCYDNNSAKNAKLSFTNTAGTGVLETPSISINNSYTLPTTVANNIGDVMAYTSEGLASWVPIASVSNTGVLLSTTPNNYSTNGYPIGTPFELLPAVGGKTYIITDIRIKLAGEFEFTDTTAVINISAYDGTTYTPYFSFTGANFNSIFHPSGWLLNYQANSSVLLGSGASASAFIETITIAPGANQSVVINQTVASDTTASFIISLTYYLA